jgi:hypothetical protein
MAALLRPVKSKFSKVSRKLLAAKHKPFLLACVFSKNILKKTKVFFQRFLTERSAPMAGPH